MRHNIKRQNRAYARPFYMVDSNGDFYKTIEAVDVSATYSLGRYTLSLKCCHDSIMLIPSPSSTHNISESV